MKTRTLAACALIAAAAAAAPAAAQQSPVPAEQMVRALQPVAPATRALIRKKDPAAAALMEAAPTQALAIAFEPDSAHLTVQGMVTLRALAVALQDQRLAGSRFAISASAFSPTNPVNAQRLGAMQADAVVQHLQAFYEIPATRVFASGPAPGQSAYGAPVNAVTVTNIGPMN